jgi:hypothetical protein
MGGFFFTVSAHRSIIGGNWIGVRPRWSGAVVLLILPQFHFRTFIVFGGERDATPRGGSLVFVAGRRVEFIHERSAVQFL